MSEEKIIRCFICKRRLMGLHARSIGVGPVCAKKHPARVAAMLVEAAGQNVFPFKKETK